jgi:hypothetical protein
MIKISSLAKIAILALAGSFFASGCSPVTKTEEDSGNFQPSYNCANVQVTYDVMPDSTDPDAIAYCESIGQFVR